MFESSYRFGPKSVLTEGTKFRVSGGPYYTTNDGERLSMAERGVLTFSRYEPKQNIIHAMTKKGFNAVLYVGPEKPSGSVEGMTDRPYSIRNRVRQPKRKRGRK